MARLHGNAAAAGREIPSLENQLPALAAVGRLVQAAVGGVAPELARHAHVHGVGAARVDDDLRDALRIGQTHVAPRLAAVGRLVDAVADRNAVTGPRLAGADPDVPVVGRVDRDRADRRHRLLVEHGLEGRRAVGRFPHAAARCAHEQRHLAGSVAITGERRDATAHGRRADVARAEPGDNARVERHRSGGLRGSAASPREQRARR